ncbi:MAG: GNAT family N-acetyltransferase [Candidatus Eisenbacteria bacterium]
MNARIPLVDAVRIERAEARAWLDLHAAAPQGAIDSLGLRARTLGSVALLAADHSDSLLHNRVIGVGLLEPASDALLDRVAQHYARNASGYAINLCPLAEPHDTPDQLARRGFQTFFHHVKWVRGATMPESARTDLRIAPVQLADAECFSETVHEHDTPAREAQLAWTAASVGRPRWTHLLAWDGGQPVAGAAVFVDGDTAWLGQAHTRESFRRRGAQQALLSERIRLAIAAGATLFTTETAPDWPDLPRESLRNVARAGFRVAYQRPSWIRLAS